jgi:hypothetical protein
MDSLRVPSKLIRDFSISNVSTPLRSSPSARCSTVANKIYRFMDVLVLRLFRLMIYCIMLCSLGTTVLLSIFIFRFVFTPLLHLLYTCADSVIDSCSC